MFSFQYLQCENCVIIIALCNMIVVKFPAKATLNVLFAPSIYRKTVNPLPYLICIHHIHTFTFKTTFEHSLGPLCKKLLLGILQLKNEVNTWYTCTCNYYKCQHFVLLLCLSNILMCNNFRGLEATCYCTMETIHVRLSASIELPR